jgi:hypothetical protein
MRPVLVLLLALTLVPSALSADPHTRTISGVVTANSGTSLTVSSADRSLTCLVTGAKAQAAIARWGTGVQAAMACKQAGDKLFLARLSRTSSTEPTRGGGTTTTVAPPATATEPARTTFDARGKVTGLVTGAITVLRPDGSSLVCSVTDGQLRSVREGAPLGSYVSMVCGGTGDRPALISLQRVDTPATTPAPAKSDNRQAIGVVTALSSDAVTVKPERGDALRCRITPATDSAAATAKLSLGARVGIVCRRDGDTYVLSGATSAG